MKMLTAYAYEVDECEYALDEILEQLDLPQNQRANSVGILTCHPDYFETGVAQYIAKELPFDVIGCTTVASMVNGVSEALLLTLTVFTSDEVFFSAGWSGTDDPTEQSVSALYLNLAQQLPAPPTMGIPLFPMMVELGGEEMLRFFESVSGDVPFFGTLAFDSTPDLSKCEMLYNGERCKHAICLLLMSGSVNPVFYIESLSEGQLQKHRAVITKSNNAIMMEVNDLPVLDYLRSIGIASGEKFIGTGAVPLVVDFGDGTKPVARAVHKITDEGYAFCGGFMPEGVTIAIGAMTPDGIIKTAETVSSAVAKHGKSDGVLMFPCGSRFLVMGATPYVESQLARKSVEQHMPYHLAYSGGEICPVYDQSGNPVNRFHSFTFTACVFT